MGRTCCWCRGPGSPSGQHRAAGDLGLSPVRPLRGPGLVLVVLTFLLLQHCVSGAEIILRGHDFLSAFGALWFSFIRLPGLLEPFSRLHRRICSHGAWWRSTTSSRHALCAGLCWRAWQAGYATAGFLLQMYPPWMVPLAYTFAAALVGLFVRDRLWKQIIPRNLACGLGLAAVPAGVIVVVFFPAVQPEFQLSRTARIRGQRRLNEATCRWPASSAACTTGTPFAAHG